MAEKTTQAELDEVSGQIGQQLRDLFPDVGFVLLVVAPPALLEEMDGTTSWEQPFACRSNAANSAMFMSVLAKGLAWGAAQDSERLVVPSGEVVN